MYESELHYSVTKHKLRLYVYSSVISPWAGYLGQNICLIRRDRNISCLGGRVSGLCIGLSLVPRPPRSGDE